MTNAIQPPPMPPVPEEPGLDMDRETFKLAAWKWTAAQVVLFDWIAEVSGQTYANAIAASASAGTAEAMTDAEKWDAAQNYHAGFVVWSPMNGRPYRRKEPGGTTATDPSLDPANWIDVLKKQPLLFVLTGEDVQAQVGHCYLLTASGLTLTLPALPMVGDVVGIKAGGVGMNTLIMHNGNPVEGYMEDINLTDRFFSKALEWSGTTKGWVSTWL